MDIHISLVGRRDLCGEIYRQLRRAMLDGRLRPGDPLPPTRELARRLGVARTTVTVSYDRLAAEGFVTSRVGAGTYVAEHAGRAREPGRQRTPGALRGRAVWDGFPLLLPFARPAEYDFRTGIPDPRSFPHDTWRRLMARALRAEGSAVYGHPAGLPALRQAIARHIGISRGVEASWEDVTVTAGTQQALDVIARALLEPGDRVAMEDPGYPPIRFLLQSIGTRVVGVPVDRHGLRVDRMPRGVRMVYVTPSHQYPTGVTMDLGRRRALLAWAEQHDAAVVEDDYDSEFRFASRPIEPLQTLDAGGRVIYVGSFSKTLLPGLRLGFVVTPPGLREAVHKAKFVADWHSATPGQAALARFIDDGGFARHLRRMGTVYRERHELLLRTLRRELDEHLEVIPSVAGLHLAATARRAGTEEIAAVVRRAWEQGVAVQELAIMAVRPPGPPGLLFGYGAIGAERIVEGIRRLRGCFEQARVPREPADRMLSHV